MASLRDGESARVVLVDWCFLCRPSRQIDPETVKLSRILPSSTAGGELAMCLYGTGIEVYELEWHFSQWFSCH